MVPTTSPRAPLASVSAIVHSTPGSSACDPVPFHDPWKLAGMPCAAAPEAERRQAERTSAASRMAFHGWGTDRTKRLHLYAPARRWTRIPAADPSNAKAAGRPRPARGRVRPVQGGGPGDTTGSKSPPSRRLRGLRVGFSAKHGRGRRWISDREDDGFAAMAWKGVREGGLRAGVLAELRPPSIRVRGQAVSVADGQ